MKRVLTTAYAVICTLLLCAGFLSAFAFAWQAGTVATVKCIAGLIVGFIFAPIFHELGHIVFAKLANMRIAYVKCFCFAWQGGVKGKLRLTSPFAPDETQAVPACGGNMQRRAVCFTLGGLLVGALFLFIVLTAAIICTCIGNVNFLLWGIVPYAAYLVLLNSLPVEYASGKTDTLVWLGLKKGYPEERNMLAAMEIQGRLFAGETFGEIDEKLYYDVPQLCEDQPLYAVMLDLRYCYHIERDEYEKAGDALNRLALAQAYLSDTQLQKVSAELVYMHAIGGDLQRAKESAALCEEYLTKDALTAKRALAAYMLACGERERASLLIAQAETLLAKEWIKGVAASEKILLSRIKRAANG